MSEEENLPTCRKCGNQDFKYNSTMGIFQCTVCYPDPTAHVFTGPSGLKYDSDKPKVGMVINYFCLAIMTVAAIGTYGAKKYGKQGTHWDHNWLEVKEAKERYTDALFRHYMAYASGEWLDTESGYPHLGHCAWNVLALLELGIRGE